MTAKKIIPKVLIIAFVIGFGVLCAFTGNIQSPVGTLWSLFPPIVAIGLALLTKEVYSSLFIGIVVGGLLHYGFKEDAYRIAKKFISMVERCYEETGHLWEKYNVVDGSVRVQNEYEMPAMLGWTFGVYTWMKESFRCEIAFNEI